MVTAAQREKEFECESVGSESYEVLECFGEETRSGEDKFVFLSAVFCDKFFAARLVVCVGVGVFGAPNRFLKNLILSVSRRNLFLTSQGGSTRVRKE